MRRHPALRQSLDIAPVQHRYADDERDRCNSDVDALDGTVRYDVIIDIAGNRPMRELRRGLTTCGTVALVGMETDGRLAGGFVSRILRSALGR